MICNKIVSDEKWISQDAWINKERQMEEWHCACKAINEMKITTIYAAGILGYFVSKNNALTTAIVIVDQFESTDNSNKKRLKETGQWKEYYNEQAQAS